MSGLSVTVTVGSVWLSSAMACRASTKLTDRHRIANVNAGRVMTPLIRMHAKTSGPGEAEQCASYQRGKGCNDPTPLPTAVALIAGGRPVSGLSAGQQNGLSGTDAFPLSQWLARGLFVPSPITVAGAALAFHQSSRLISAPETGSGDTCHGWKFDGGNPSVRWPKVNLCAPPAGL